jgi:hypothetical protein
VKDALIKWLVPKTSGSHSHGPITELSQLNKDVRDNDYDNDGIYYRRGIDIQSLPLCNKV